MIEKQETVIIEPQLLKAACKEKKEGGFRLVQIGCTKTGEGFEINYTFDRDYEFANLRLAISPEQAIESIQDVYECAYLYENEFSELFGIAVNNMAVDFQGKFYKIPVSAPFGFSKPEAKGEEK